MSLLRTATVQLMQIRTKQKFGKKVYNRFIVFQIQPEFLIVDLDETHIDNFTLKIWPHAKPRWIPMARSKMFKEPPVSLIFTILNANIVFNLSVTLKLIANVSQNFNAYTCVGEP